MGDSYLIESVKIFKFLNTNDPTPEQACEMDEVAIEDPLEIQVVHFSRERQKQTRNRIAITMRTPGSDLELASGFLFSESILKSPHDILQIKQCPNLLEFTLSPICKLELERFERHSYVSSSCGICGKRSIEQVWEQTQHCDHTAYGTGPFVSSQIISRLPQELHKAQRIFSRTGGLHASGLFSDTGKLLLIQEDVGRHNALDKVIGRAFLDQLLPLDRSILMLSGRVSFELMQKAAIAGIRIIVAVGAPSTLAVRIAKEFDLTLIGFAKEQRFNIYHGEWRVKSP